MADQTIGERARQFGSRAYQEVKRGAQYVVPKTSGQGKGEMYAAIGIGSAIALGLVGYGIYDAVESGISGSSQALAKCESAYTAQVELYDSTLQSFINEDVASNVPISTPQNSYLNGIITQENSIASSCYKDNWVASSASTISIAIAIGIVAISGALAYKFIRSKGYTKQPPKGGTPAGSMARVQMGILDYLRTAGIIPAEWSSGGATTVRNTANQYQSQAQQFTQIMVDDGYMTEALAAEIIAAEAAEVAEAEEIALLAFGA